MTNTVTPEQRFELGKKVAEKIGAIGANGNEVQVAIEDKDDLFWLEVERRFGQKTAEKMFTEQLTSWTALYTELGVVFDPAQIKMPTHREGFDRLIVVPKGMMAQKAFELCSARFGGNCWKYTSSSLDQVVPEDKNDRTAEAGSYAIWIRDRQEADKELKSQSADDLTTEEIKGITLCERLLFEIKYHAETGKHLDVKNWTLCSGSRNSGGNVPSVYWCDGKLNVGCYGVSSRDPNLRSRAVSL